MTPETQTEPEPAPGTQAGTPGGRANRHSPVGRYGDQAP